MALTPIKGDWADQLPTGDSATFTIETLALRTTNVVYNPVLRFYNFGTESFSLVIVHTLDLGSATDDPLHSGTFSQTVVDAIIPTGAFYDYDFGGAHLDNNSTMHTTHTVTVQNLGTLTQIFHALLFGRTEVQTQIGAGSVITWTD